MQDHVGYGTSNHYIRERAVIGKRLRKRQPLQICCPTGASDNTAQLAFHLETPIGTNKGDALDTAGLERTATSNDARQWPMLRSPPESVREMNGENLQSSHAQSEKLGALAPHRTAVYPPRCSKPLPFRYQTLESDRCIRLIRLEREPSMSRVRCSVIALPIDSPWLPNYTALSYAWGETFADGSHLTQPLLCDGELLKITRILHRPLVSIFEKKGEIHLWADGICVNQADAEERSRQVALMGEIYSKAGDTMVWLGEYSSGAEQWLQSFFSILPHLDTSVFNLHNERKLKESIASLSIHKKEELSQLLRRPHVELEDRWVLMALQTAQMDLVSRSPAPSKRPRPRSSTNSLLGPRQANDSNMWHSEGVQLVRLVARRNRAVYIELTQRPWFRRKWVIQEMAQTSGKRRCFLIGDQLKSFAELQTAIQQHQLQDTAMPLFATVSDKSLLQNLFLYRNTQCTDPRDHIYALIGISNDAAGIRVDYSKDVEIIYVELARHYALRGSYMDLLAIASSQKASEILPSWVPDWRGTWDCARSAVSLHTLQNFISSSTRQLWRRDDHNRFVHAPEFTRRWLRLRGWIISNCTHNTPQNTGLKSECRKCRLLSWWRTSLYQDNIRLQFEHAKGEDDVLCLLERCGIGFMLSPARDTDRASALPTFSIKFCFQVDDESSFCWFAHVLDERQEWVYIV